MPLEMQIVSDLHLEFYHGQRIDNFIKPAAPILALLGDTCCVAGQTDYEQFAQFIRCMADKFQLVIVIPGNHEYYLNVVPTQKNGIKVNRCVSMTACDTKMSALCKELPNVVFLNNQMHKIVIGRSKYLIAGTPLWSYIPQEAHQAAVSLMNDYRYIYVNNGRRTRLATPTDTTALHLCAVRFIRRSIAKAKKHGYRLVVLTHHKPYFIPTAKQKEPVYTYETPLNDMIGAPMVLWAYGHTHKHDEQRINGVLIYSNPSGYPGEKTRFEKDRIISV
jgi:predicted MPP superfamily phosphohydrolase